MVDIKRIFQRPAGELKKLLEANRDNKNISVFGMYWADRIIASSLIERLVYVCPDFVAAGRCYEEMKGLREKVVYLPAKNDVLTFAKSKSRESEFFRIRTLYDIVTGNADIVVTTPEAMGQLFPDRKLFEEAIVRLESGKDYNLENVSSALREAGYRRENQIELAGQYALRGDILDIAPVNEDRGIRVEFFDDTIESIRYFDLAGQTSGERLNAVAICPAGELFAPGGEAEEILRQLKKDIPAGLDAQKQHRIESILSDIAVKLLSGQTDTSLSVLLPYARHSSFSEFARYPTIVYDDVKQLNLKLVFDEHSNRYKQLLGGGEIFKRFYENLTLSGLDYSGAKLAFYNNLTSNNIFDPDAIFNFSSMPLPNYSKEYSALFYDIKLWLTKGYRIYLCCGSEQMRERMQELFSENDLYCGAGYDTVSDVVLLDAHLDKGAVFHEQSTIIIGTYDLAAKKQKKTVKRNKKDVYSDPKVGDYVVHYVHGIGIADSITKLENNGAQRDYLVVMYKDGDKLYLPIENIDSLTRYSMTDETPRLSKIGGGEFARVKERVKQSVKKMAIDLAKLYAEREMARGYKYPPNDHAMQEFEADFPYVETDDQLQAIADCMSDLTQGKIMDRLLCGDVGYGKTEVALRAAYKVILEGKQVAFISPTTILAKQHYNTASARMSKFGVNVCSLTRLDPASDIKSNLKKLRDGKADIVCGTHRLLSKDVAFKDLGLMILDEEQRFGVADKEKIKLLKNTVNVLSLSATPIPRTLHMATVGIRDISILDTPPAERIPVQTYVTEYSDTLVLDAIGRELARGGQAFIVYNRVSTIYKYASDIQNLLPDAKVGVVHGQLPETSIESAINNFVSGETDILVASTIIENGIDMPRANTMIVVDSDRLGLSQLYQLRGRIGRSNRLAYIFFTYDPDKLLSETAYKRLEAITEFTEFGAGFRIALKDLEIRGAGNILGREQHGHMEKVGYEMYTKLLSEVMEEIKGNEYKQKKEVKINIDFDAFVPENYVRDEEWRIKIYTRISRIDSPEELAELKANLEDIYGPVPKSVIALAKVAMLKNLAEPAGADSVTFKAGRVSLDYKRAVDIPKKLADIVGSASGCSLEVKSYPSVTFGKGPQAEENIVKFLLMLRDL